MDSVPHILIIDDEEDMLWAMEYALRADGFNVTSFSNGKQALVCLKEQVIAVAFVDAKLPDLDGLTLIGMIRAQFPQTAIILVTGFYYQEDSLVIEGIKNHLFNFFLAKPFQLKDILTLAHRAVEVNREMQ